MPILAMTREMGSLGSAVALAVSRQLGYEFMRDELIARVARQFRVRQASVVGVVEEAPGWLERWRPPGWRFRTYLEAAVLEAAERERVVLMGRWSTVFLRGVPHAVRVRVCAPLPVRARRVAARHGIEEAEAARRIAVYDDGVRARMRQTFDLEWADPLLYDLVVNTEAVSLDTGVRQVLALLEAPEFQPTDASRALLADRALGARVRATLKAGPGTRHLDLDARASSGVVVLSGVVASEDERDTALGATRGLPGVRDVRSEVKVFRRPVR